MYSTCIQHLSMHMHTAHVHNIYRRTCISPLTLAPLVTHHSPLTQHISVHISHRHLSACMCISLTCIDAHAYITYLCTSLTGTDAHARIPHSTYTESDMHTAVHIRVVHPGWLGSPSAAYTIRMTGWEGSTKFTGKRAS